MPKPPKAEITFKSNLKAVEAVLDRAAWERMERACQHLVNETKKAMTGPKSGRWYIKPGIKTIAERVATLRTAKIARKEKKLGRPLTEQEKTQITAKLTPAQLQARKYRASAPGETPALRTGRLFNSIDYYVIGTGLNLRGIVGSPLEYAPYLEFGTSKMERRPFLRPTYERERENVKDILGGKWV
ncbi:MAG TPA: hypothetical protein GXX40_05685 [Firmicutes bacterium]|nr:hypothetical protein [Bacillota bacterium]